MSALRRIAWRWVESEHDGILKFHLPIHLALDVDVRSRLDAVPVPVPVLPSDNESSTILDPTSIDYKSNEKSSVSGVTEKTAWIDSGIEWYHGSK